jgi:hypothetical protein
LRRGLFQFLVITLVGQVCIADVVTIVQLELGVDRVGVEGRRESLLLGFLDGFGFNADTRGNRRGGSDVECKLGITKPAVSKSLTRSIRR